MERHLFLFLLLFECLSLLVGLFDLEMFSFEDVQLMEQSKALVYFLIWEEIPEIIEHHLEFFFGEVVCKCIVEVPELRQSVDALLGFLAGNEHLVALAHLGGVA